MEKIIRSNKDLGAAIRLQRKARNLRQVDVARKASVRQAMVSELENGATAAKLDTLIRVLAALDTDDGHTLVLPSDCAWVESRVRCPAGNNTPEFRSCHRLGPPTRPRHPHLQSGCQPGDNLLRHLL